MKKLLLLTIAFSLSTIAFSQQYGWTDISANLPQYANYNDVHFIGDEGWITGGNDKVYYTPDGGETFQIQTLPANSGISSSVFMKNNMVGYVVTYSGKILKTENGGTNWTMLYEPGGTLNSVHFPPTLDIGYTCGNNGKIYAFTDSSIVDMTVEGLTATLQSIFFPINSSEGKLCGNSTIRRWRDSTWNNLQILDNTYFYNSIFFIDNNTGWVVGSLGKIFKTVDATIWNLQRNKLTNSLNDVIFIDSLEGWAAGSQVLLHTVDGGENWTQEIASQTFGMELVAIYFTSANNGYVVGNDGVLKYGIVSGEANNDATLSGIQINSEELSGFNAATLNYQVESPTGTTTVPTVAATPGDANATVVITQAAEIPGTATILVSAEDGVTQQTYTVEFTVAQNTGWQVLSPESIPGTPDFSDVFFVSDDEGWITSSSQAEIYHTTDGGETFEVQTTQYTCDAIHMLNANEGYAGGASGFIYKTTDGGEHWNFYGTMVANLADISFPPNGDTGYCCGINGNIHAITSSGVTKMTSNINGDLSSISFPVNSEEGWVCGGDVIRHYDNNVWNGDQDYPSGGYGTIYMVDNLNGWIVGENGAIIHTSDGKNWATQQTNPAYILTDVFFMNTQQGWAVGSGGGIFHTTNGGINWNIEGAELSSSILRGVHFTSPTNGYVVGNGKTLLKYTELPTGVGVGQELEALKFEIYPNPATKKFKVQSSMFKVEDAEIELYDLNGKRLLEKQILAGTENVEIDVSHLKNGVYFCRLFSEKYSATQKLIIQK